MMQHVPSVVPLIGQAIDALQSLSASIMHPMGAVVAFFLINLVAWVTEREQVGHAPPSPVTVLSPVAAGATVRRPSLSDVGFHVGPASSQSHRAGSARLRLTQEIALLRREAAKHNTPSTYAQCAKLQRAANAKEKELAKLAELPAVPQSGLLTWVPTLVKVRRMPRGTTATRAHTAEEKQDG